MKRGRRLMLTALILLTCVAVAPGAQTSDAPGLSPLRARMVGSITGTRYGLYLSADPSVAWKPGVVALGAGMELLVGVSQFDIYALPYLQAQLAWFHLDVGYALALLRSPAGDGLSGMSVGMAVAPEPWEFAYGDLGFKAGLDFIPGRFLDVAQALSGATVVERLAVSAVLSGRFIVGITYSFDL